MYIQLYTLDCEILIYNHIGPSLLTIRSIGKKPNGIESLGSFLKLASSSLVIVIFPLFYFWSSTMSGFILSSSSASMTIKAG
jgi:hypothetical protein